MIVKIFYNLQFHFLSFIRNVFVFFSIFTYGFFFSVFVVVVVVVVVLDTSIQVFLSLVPRVFPYSFSGKYRLCCFHLYFVISRQTCFHCQINRLQYLICTSAIWWSRVALIKVGIVPMLLRPFGRPVVNYLTFKHSLNLFFFAIFFSSGFQTVTLLFLLKAKYKKLSFLYSPENLGRQSSAEKRFLYFIFDHLIENKTQEYFLQRWLPIWVFRVGSCS